MSAATSTITQHDADRRTTVVRIGLVVLGLGQGFAAVWALLAPRAFYNRFPVAGAHWVSALPPFNEHLVRDYGASFLALSVLALIAAWLADRRVMQVTLVVWAVAAIPHLIFHLAHSDEPAGGRGISSLITLALNAAVPLLLLALIPKENPASVESAISRPKRPSRTAATAFAGSAPSLRPVAHNQPHSSSGGTGRCKRKPWTRSHPQAVSWTHCSSVSTPSATTSRPSEWPRSIAV